MTRPSMSDVVAVIGSRDFPDLDMVRDYVRSLPPGTEVVSGGARGVDTVAEETARSEGLSVRSIPADWETHGKRAGYLRNVDLIDAAYRTAAFWDGQSRGTRHGIGLTMDAKKPLDLFVRPRAEHE